jgi:hypothetical protein
MPAPWDSACTKKISAAMRVIAYGIPDDYTDEYLCIGENTTILSVQMFAKTIDTSQTYL